MKTLIPILKTKLFVLSFLSACTVILATTVPQIKNFIAPKPSEEKVFKEKERPISSSKKKAKSTLQSRFGIPADASSTATVVSDKADYGPGSTAIFIGNGFGPNENVVLKVKNLNQPCNTVASDSSYLPWTVTTDGSGHFETTWTVCDCPGDSLRLKAVGQISGLIAYAYFTDALAFTAVISPNSTCASATSTFSIVITNTTSSPPNGSGARLGSIRVTPPSGFTGIGSLSISPAAMASRFSINLVAGNIDVARTGGTGNSLDPLESLTINFTATAPSSSISNPYVWNTSAWNENDFTTTPFPAPSPQPSVTVNSPTCLISGSTGPVCPPGSRRTL